jgi:hypothetical protein
MFAVLGLVLKYDSICYVDNKKDTIINTKKIHYDEVHFFACKVHVIVYLHKIYAIVLLFLDMQVYK